jgi:hypothetical protein
VDGIPEFEGVGGSWQETRRAFRRKVIEPPWAHPLTGGHAVGGDGLASIILSRRAKLDPIEPPMDTLDVVSSHAATAGSVRRGEGILTVRMPNFIAKALGT